MHVYLLVRMIIHYAGNDQATVDKWKPGGKRMNAKHLVLIPC